VKNINPHRKEQVLVFIRYIGNKDTSAVYPKSMQVNRQNVINALFWLKKYNPHYSNVTINELNLDWMKYKDEANIGSRSYYSVNKKHTMLQGPNDTREDGFECPQRIDFSDCVGNTCDIEIGAMHPNVGNSLLNAHNTKIIQSLIDIAKNTDQSSKIKNFPSIDHDNPVAK
jgi:hypothetical protein